MQTVILKTEKLTSTVIEYIFRMNPLPGRNSAEVDLLELEAVELVLGQRLLRRRLHLRPQRPVHVGRDVRPNGRDDVVDPLHLLHVRKVEPGGQLAQPLLEGGLLARQRDVLVQQGLKAYKRNTCGSFFALFTDFLLL